MDLYNSGVVQSWGILICTEPAAICRAKAVDWVMWICGEIHCGKSLLYVDLPNGYILELYCSDKDRIDFRPMRSENLFPKSLSHSKVGDLSCFLHHVQMQPYNLCHLHSGKPYETTADYIYMWSVEKYISGERTRDLRSLLMLSQGAESYKVKHGIAVD